jgi:hypothetical protein
MPVILLPWKAKIEKIVVSGQLGQGVCENTVHSIVVVGSLKWEDCSTGLPGQKVRPYLKNNAKKFWRHDSNGRIFT